MEGKIYFLEWKGVESGPFSIAEIRGMLACGKIGLLHKIGEKNSAFVALKDVDLDALECAAIRTKSAPTDIAEVGSYAVAGLAFLSPWTLAASAVFSVYLWTAGAKKTSVLSAVLSAVFAFLGILFFDILYQTLKS